jgi:hypothetical protein
VAKRLGNWTTARAFQVRARRSQVVIDLRSPQIPVGDIGLDLDLDHSTIKLLVAEDSVIDQWDLAWTGRGKVKQAYHPGPAGAGRRIRLTGHIRSKRKVGNLAARPGSSGRSTRTRPSWPRCR